jgi:hypothetical protein
MLGAFGGANLSPTQSAQLDLIRQSVAAQEPGRGHMVELQNSLLDETEESLNADPGAILPADYAQITPCGSMTVLR